MQTLATIGARWPLLERGRVLIGRRRLLAHLLKVHDVSLGRLVAFCGVLVCQQVRVFADGRGLDQFQQVE